MSSQQQLTQEQLERIALNRAMAMDRKRKLEEAKAASEETSKKRLSSAPTPSRCEPSMLMARALAAIENHPQKQEQPASALPQNSKQVPIFLTAVEFFP